MRSGVGIGVVQKKGTFGGDREDGSSSATGFAEYGGCARRGDGRIDVFHIVERLGRVAKRFFRKRIQTVNHAVRRQDQKSGAVHVDERHHGEVVGRHAPLRGGGVGGATLIAVRQGGLVTM